MDSQKFCLKWDGFQSNITSVFDHLRQDEEFVDVTLCCEGQKVKAHRMMLSACSPYFRDVLKDNHCQHVIIFLKDTSAADLRAIIEFMYKGSVNIAQSQLASFIKTAEMLQIKGLSGDDDKPPPPPAAPSPRRPPPSPRPAQPATPPTKRRCTSGPDGSAGDQYQNTSTEPLPPPPPPPPPAAAPGVPPGSPLSATDQPAASPGQYPPQTAARGADSSPAAPPTEGGADGAHAPAPAHEVKIEKVDIDLTEEDEESLDAALAYEAEYDAGYAEQELSLGSMADVAGAVGGLAGPSQRPGDDGSSQGAFQCDMCEKAYFSQASLCHHRKIHLGHTKCPLCGRISSTVPTLRRHLLDVHRMSRQEILRAVPLRRLPNVQPHISEQM